MKKLIFLTTIIAALFVFGCNSDDDVIVEDTTNIEINFTGTYGSDALQMQKEYTYGDGKAIKFVQFDFYVSDIVLLKENNPNSTLTELKEIDFIDLSNSSEEDALAGDIITIQNVPTGTYAGIKLGLGVSSELNRTKPEDYGTSSPLYDNSHYWDGWSSYIFSKIECFADLNNNDTITIGGANTEGVSYHMGTDEVYTEIEIIQNITLTPDADGKIKLNIDLSQAFDMTNPDYDDNGDGFLDIQTFTGTHTDAQLLIAKKIMENLGKSVTLEL